MKVMCKKCCDVLNIVITIMYVFYNYKDIFTSIFPCVYLDAPPTALRGKERDAPPTAVRGKDRDAPPTAVRSKDRDKLWDRSSRHEPMDARNGEQGSSGPRYTHFFAFSLVLVVLAWIHGML